MLRVHFRTSYSTTNHGPQNRVAVKSRRIKESPYWLWAALKSALFQSLNIVLHYIMNLKRRPILSNLYTFKVPFECVIKESVVTLILFFY
jgi:hypothetical protein